ncbi:ricin B lectin domain-containing protein [Trichophaea hybrida]|nr:ricin B lectin domain-containing protein [Trichophaea hybrida]
MSANLCSGVYFIRSAATGTVVHVTGCDSNLVCSTQDYDQAATQLFEFKRWDDRFVITNVGTKLVVDLAGGKQEEHTPILSCKYQGGTNQQWFIKRKGDENRFFHLSMGMLAECLLLFLLLSTYHMITNAKGGTVMDLSGGFLANGTPLIGCNAHRGSNQQWEFVGVTEHMLGRQIQVPGPERVVEKIVPGPERVVEKVVEKVVQGPGRMAETLVIHFNDSPETPRELRELRAQILRAMEGWGHTPPSGTETADDR